MAQKGISIVTKALEKTSASAPSFSREQIDLLTRTICRGASPDELQLFLGVCRRTGLDPFARQVFAVRRWDSKERRETMQVQVSIDGLRLVASRTGAYAGSEGPLWCGPDAQWKDVWLADEPPSAAKMGIWRAECRTPFWAVSKFSEYAQTDRDGNLTGLWRKMPANMLAKTCEALALRRAFPMELSGLYGADELDHMENGSAPVRTVPESQKPWTTFKGMVETFARLRERIGNDPLYYETLQRFGAQHSNDFIKLKDGGTKALAAYTELCEQEAGAAADEVIPDSEEL